ncbi:MAG TPA: DnaA/Hda family protein, partial [Solirubrobacteraceae bacterium]|nr:DnaA/Hda family protein [Solirubrobacteraceae bacterium]
MSAELEYIWSCVQAGLAAAVDEPTYRIWLEPLRARELSHGRLTIEASPQACGWVSDRFGRVLHACAASVLGADVVVELIPGNDTSASASSAPPGVIRPANRRGAPQATTHPHGFAPHHVSARSGTPPHSPLGNPKLTFDQFVIGDCNRLAHAAALAVAEMPAQTYNPLFICGPPGVGKTHLLSSIVSLLLSHSPDLAVRYTTGEAFTNDFLQALSGQQTDAFKTHFRHADVLLLDDVQILERK